MVGFFTIATNVELETFRLLLTDFGAIITVNGFIHGSFLHHVIQRRVSSNFWRTLDYNSHVVFYLAT